MHSSSAQKGVGGWVDTHGQKPIASYAIESPRLTGDMKWHESNETQSMWHFRFHCYEYHLELPT